RFSTEGSTLYCVCKLGSVNYLKSFNTADGSANSDIELTPSWNSSNIPFFDLGNWDINYTANINGSGSYTSVVEIIVNGPGVENLVCPLSAPTDTFTVEAGGEYTFTVNVTTAPAIGAGIGVNQVLLNGSSSAPG